MGSEKKMCNTNGERNENVQHTWGAKIKCATQMGSEMKMCNTNGEQNENVQH